MIAHKKNIGPWRIHGYCKNRIRIFILLENARNKKGVVSDVSRTLLKYFNRDYVNAGQMPPVSIGMPNSTLRTFLNQYYILEYIYCRDFIENASVIGKGTDSIFKPSVNMLVQFCFSVFWSQYRATVCLKFVYGIMTSV